MADRALVMTKPLAEYTPTIQTKDVQVKSDTLGTYTIPFVLWHWVVDAVYLHGQDREPKRAAVHVSFSITGGGVYGKNVTAGLRLSPADKQHIKDTVNAWRREHYAELLVQQAEHRVKMQALRSVFLTPPAQATA